MKKITFLFSLLITSISFSQSIPVDFTSGITVGAKSGGTVTPSDANWYSDSGLASVAVVDLAMDMPDNGLAGQINSSAAGQVFQNAQLLLQDNFIDLRDAAGTKVITLSVYSDNPQDFLLKLEQSKDNVTGNTEKGFSHGGTGWETINVDFATPNTGQPVPNDQYKLIVFFPGWDNTAGGFLPAFDSTTYVDNISATVGDAVPTPVATPTVDAPELGSTGTDLIVYSGLTGTSVTNFNRYAFGNVGVPEEDIEGNGNNASRIDGGGFYFYGAQWDAVDLAAGNYNFVHINYYATTSTEFNFYLVDETAGITGGNPEEPRYRFGGTTPDAAIVTGSWQSVFIPLQHFLDFPTPSFSYDLNDIFQWKFDGNGQIYFDNIFFSTTNVLSADDFLTKEFKVYPNPSNDVWNIQANNTINSVEVYDVLGKRVITLNPNNQQATIDGSNLKAGIYLAKLKANNATKTIRLVKN